MVEPLGSCFEKAFSDQRVIDVNRQLSREMFVAAACEAQFLGLCRLAKVACAYFHLLPHRGEGCKRFESRSDRIVGQSVVTVLALTLDAYQGRSQ